MSENLKILVINVKSSSKRRARISKLLNSLDMPYEILEATEGHLLTDEWIENNIGDYLKDVYYNNKHFSVNKNALACADSHRRAQLIASNFENGYTLILEDDAAFASNFKKKITNTIKLMEKHSLHVAFPGYHWYEGDFEKRLDVNCSGFGFSFFKYPINGRIAGAHGYIVDSVGARKLVEDNLEKIQDTADTFYINERGLNDSTVVLYPKLVTAGYFESDIGYLTSVSLAKRIKQATYSLSLKSKTVHYLLRHWKERRL